MKKHKMMQFVLATAIACCYFACDDNPGWDIAKKGVEMDIATKKISLDVQNCRMLGLLQEGTAPDASVTGYSLHFIYGYGRTITISIEPEGEGWGLRFKPLTLTFDANDSGLNFPGESDKGTVFVPAENKPLKNGTMPLIISVKDEEGQVILSHKATTFVYDKNKTLKTIQEMNRDWKLAIGDAQFYTPASGGTAAQHIKNKLIVYASFGENQISDFDNTGLTACKVVKGTPVTSLLQLNQYIAVEDVSGIFWQSPSQPFEDVSLTWAKQAGTAQIFDYTTGEEIPQTNNFKAAVNGVQARSVTNEQANDGAPWNTCVLDGAGDERLIDIRNTTASWYIGALTPATFDRAGTYILQWELLNKRPGNNPSMPLQVIGKLRAIIQVVENL